jgi:uncharacterized glyoxalase superfamily protein PhnB
MADKVRRVPEGYRTITPHLTVRNGSEAIEFYKRAFGAKELRRASGPDGKSIMHAELQVGDSRFFINDEAPQMGAMSPLALKGTAATIHLYVEDVDKLYQQAVKAGAQVVMPLADQFWGDRYALVTDPSGHRWSMASHVKDMTQEEMAKAAAAAFSQMSK